MRKKIALTLIILISVTSLFIYSILNTKEEKEVKEPVKKNQMVAFTVDGENVDISFPQKGEGYKGESVTCTNGITGVWNNDRWELELSNLTVKTNCTINFIEYTPYLYEKILEDNPNIETRTDFSTIFTESNNGNTIYKSSGQDGKDTYYFAGSVTNNYVYFGGYYWRIVRINEDNSVRLIYAGTSADDTAAFIGTSQAFNTSRNNSSYVGYMYTLGQQYGTSTNSSIKTAVDNWYASNLDSYDNYISKTAIYCNDRTVGSGTWSATGNTTFYYAADERLRTNKTPTFVCSNVNDRFTASSTAGNGKLTYPIGLITADEISYAGGLWATNNSNYYMAQNASSGVTWWRTMSPRYWNGDGAYSSSFVVGGTTSTGYLSSGYVTNEYGARPVISLKACVLTSGGNGTASDPYTVEFSDECANVENEILEENTVRVSATTNDTNMATVNAPSSVIINGGNSHTFTLTVNNSSKYESVTGCNGTYDISTNKLTVSNVTSNTTCQVNFKLKTYTVSAAPNSTTYATVTAPSSVSVSHGGSYTFTFTVKAGYEYSSLSNCTGGSYNKSTNKLTVSNVTSNRSCTVNFKALSPLYAQVLEDNPNVSTRSSFSSIFTASNNGNTIYKASGQNNKTTYYFAGSVTNNYVKFANKYWRIIRINEDNSVRLIYAGTSATDTAAFISTSQTYNSSYNNSSYVGYMYTLSQQYGTNTNSPIKTVLDNWYASNLSSYSGYISKTAIYCNDRTVASGSTWRTTGREFDYAAYGRLYTNKTPTFVCSNANDRFTASTTTGNGKLAYPIGLITADEISYAGGLYDTNNTSYYIAQNASSGADRWWTMSPSYWYNSSACVFGVGSADATGYLTGHYIRYAFGVRPVISLKACVTTTGGSGTASNPYTVSVSSACSSAEN